MANPNIVNVSSIYGKTVSDADIATGSPVTLVTCATDKILKLNSLVIANIDGTNAADISVYLQGNGTNLAAAAHYLAKTISVPADSTLVVISKDISVYLLEGDYLAVESSATGDLSAVLSYEELDDA